MQQLLQYAIVEDSEDARQGIIKRMEAFTTWQLVGQYEGITLAKKELEKNKPHLIFLDWKIMGGSAFEILQHLQNIPNYKPYIIFNTAYTSDSPLIAEEMVNRYKADKYLVKPIFPKLTENLADYLEEAKAKYFSLKNNDKTHWLEDENKIRYLIDFNELVFIYQHPIHSRKRNFYFANKAQPITIQLTWIKCVELLNQFDISYFISNAKAHIICKKYLIQYAKPIAIFDTQHEISKVEITAERLKDFEEWLVTR
jgi:two-component system, LytTR family, response regulator